MDVCRIFEKFDKLYVLAEGQVRKGILKWPKKLLKFNRISHYDTASSRGPSKLLKIHFLFSRSALAAPCRDRNRKIISI